MEKAEAKRSHNPVEMNLFDLILRDMEIDFELIKSFRGNITALKGYMGSIGNMRTRETFRKFLTDSDGVLSQMSNQRTIIIEAIKKAKKQCEQEKPELLKKDPPPSIQPMMSAESATDSKSTSSDPKDSSAPVAPGQEKSPPSQG